MIQYLYLFLTLLFYGNLEGCLNIALNDGNMVWYRVFLGLYYKRNAIYVGIVLTLIGWYYNLFVLNVIGLLISTFFSFQMISLICKYKLT